MNLFNFSEISYFLRSEFFKTLKSNLFKNSIFLYVIQFCILFFGYVNFIIINNYGNITLYGKLAILASATGLITSIIQTRINSSIVFFLSKETDKKIIVILGLLFDLLIAITVFIIINICKRSIEIYFIKEAIDKNALFIYSIIPFFRIIRGTPNGILIFVKKFRLIGIFNFSDQLLKIILMLYFSLSRNILSLNNAIFSYLIPTIIVSILMYIFAYFSYRSLKYKKSNERRQIFKQMLKYNFYNFTTQTLKSITQNIDNLLVAYFLNCNSVGVYQILKKICDPVLYIISPFKTLCYPRIVELYNKKEFSTIKVYILKIAFGVTCLSLLYSLGIVLFHSYVFQILNIVSNSDIVIYLYLILIQINLIVPLWWTNSLSNSINPIFSFKDNVIRIIYLLTVTIFVTWKFKITGMIIANIFLMAILHFYWWKKLYFVEKYFKKKI